MHTNKKEWKKREGSRGINKWLNLQLCSHSFSYVNRLCQKWKEEFKLIPWRAGNRNEGDSAQQKHFSLGSPDNIATHALMIILTNIVLYFMKLPKHAC